MNEQNAERMGREIGIGSDWVFEFDRRTI